MGRKKVTQMTVDTSPTLDDLVMTINDPSGTPANRKISLVNLSKIVLNSGTSEPSSTFAYQFWADTTTGYLKMRNAANDAWITEGTLADTNWGIGPFPSGTKMLFYQNTAPVGWTIQNTLDDKVVYITKGSVAGGQTGGGIHSTGSWTISGITQVAHVHTGPSHTHAIQNSATLSGDTIGYGVTVSGGLLKPTGFNVTDNIAVASATTTAGGTGETSSIQPAISHNGTWRPSALCCIIAQKD